jgi:hypothetical protein
MFRTKKEMQGLINSSRKSLANAEMMIAERNKFLKEIVVKDRKGKELIRKIKYLTECNNYSRPDIILNKIKELIRDYQSEN